MIGAYFNAEIYSRLKPKALLIVFNDNVFGMAVNVSNPSLFIVTLINLSQIISQVLPGICFNQFPRLTLIKVSKFFVKPFKKL